MPHTEFASVITRLTEIGGNLQIKTPFSAERKLWPGPFRINTDPDRYLYDAMQPLLTSWEWDDPGRRAELLNILNHDQLAVWSIWNIDGQIENGGSPQAISNSYGEVCEDAIIGFAQLGLQDYAEMFDHVFSCYERPISRDRGERTLMLERVAGLTGSNQDLNRFNDINYIAKIWENCRKVSDVAEKPYWELKRTKSINIILCEAVDNRKDRFFR